MKPAAYKFSLSTPFSILLTSNKNDFIEDLPEPNELGFEPLTFLSFESELRPFVDKRAPTKSSYVETSVAISFKSSPNSLKVVFSV